MSNFKNVLKVFKMIRDFEPDDHALLNTLRNATETDIDLLIETVGPVKRAGKKAAKSAGKSRRAASIGTQLQQTRHAPDAVCAFVYADGKACGQSWANAIHDENAGYAGYHEFVPPALTAKDDNYEEQVVGAGGN